MGGLTKFAAVAILAAIAGIYAADLLRDGRFEIVERQLGHWKTWPSAGTANADPYTRAHFIASKRLPLSRFEALEFEARIDPTGQPLSSECRYKIVGQLPPVRKWSISSYNVEDEENIVPGSNSSLSSSQAIFQSYGDIELTLSNTAASGNWLRPNGEGEQTLILRLFNPTYSAGRDTIAKAPLSIQRLECL